MKHKKRGVCREEKEGRREWTKKVKVIVKGWKGEEEIGNTREDGRGKKKKDEGKRGRRRRTKEKGK